MKDLWEVLIQGNDYESSDIFEQVAKTNALYLEGKITDEEYEGTIDDLEDRDDEFILEISVIKKDNKHGHRSYGWGGEDKIILWDSSGGVGNRMFTGNIIWCKKVAEQLCDNLNKMPPQTLIDTYDESVSEEWT